MIDKNGTIIKKTKMSNKSNESFILDILLIPAYHVSTNFCWQFE